MHGRETLSALFPDEASGERAMERLRALGVPEASMELHRTRAEDPAPDAQLAAPLGLGGLLSPAVPAGAPRGAVVVVASGVSGELVAEARRVLGDEGRDLEESEDPGPAEPDERWDG